MNVISEYEKKVTQGRDLVKFVFIRASCRSDAIIFGIFTKFAIRGLLSNFLRYQTLDHYTTEPLLLTHFCKPTHKNLLKPYYNVQNQIFLAGGLDT